MKQPPHPPLAAERCNYVGEPYGVVIGNVDCRRARRRRRGDDRIRRTRSGRVDHGSDEVDADLRQRAGEPQLSNGNWATKRPPMPAFARAAHVTKLDITNNRLIPNALEPRAAIGVYDRSNESFTIYTTSQNPHLARLVLSAFVKLAPEHKLRIVAPDVGGGFGSKIFIYPEETTVAWASRRIGKPVKWTADRSESFLSDAHGRDHVDARGTRARRAGPFPRPAREDDREPRRIPVDVRIVRADVSVRHAARRAISNAGDSRRSRRRVHEHRAGGCVSRRRPSRSDVRASSASSKPRRVN